MPRIGFLHTAQVHVGTFEALVREADDGSSCAHLVEPDLLARMREEGSHADVEEATLIGLQHLVDDGADVVVCTCSTLGSVAESLGARVPVPVVRVDRPMARAAVRAGTRIAVVAALESTLEPTRALLVDEAGRAGTIPAIVEVSVPDAWTAFESGNQDGYLAQVAEAARSVAGTVDVVVLAQASMMGAVALLTDLSTPVLASPRLAVQHVVGSTGDRLR